MKVSQVIQFQTNCIVYLQEHDCNTLIPHNNQFRIIYEIYGQQFDTQTPLLWGKFG